ncbi:MAG: Hsp20/alpha crystallin family protein [Gemmataceae bacterium]|nr:Hsp20/alpha crystallin family protein [Gemmataceae bacterium]
MLDTAIKNGGTEQAQATGENADVRAVTVTPRVDILETENEFLLLADLPGVKSDDVDIRFEKGELTLHGRRLPSFPGKGVAHREHPATNYQRVFVVADTVAADKITAELKDGVLTVRLPKVEAVKPKKISVRG